MALGSLVHRLVNAFDRQRIPYMLVGSLGAGLHGHLRSTMDADFVIDVSAPRLVALCDDLESSGLILSHEAALEALRMQRHFNVIDPETGWKADVMIRKDRAFSISEFARREEVEYEGRPIAVASLEDVVISKLEWARMGGSLRQIEDVRGMLLVAGDDLDRSYVEQWVAALSLQRQWAEATRQD